MSSLNEGRYGWTQFPFHWNVPGQELERKRSPVCSCVCEAAQSVCVCVTFTDSGVCVESVASRTFTLEAAKGVDALSALAQAWQLLALVDVCQKEKGNTQRHCVCVWVCVICVSVHRSNLTQWYHVAVWPSKMTVMGFGLKPSPPGHSVLYSAVTKHQTTLTSNEDTPHKPQSRLFYCRIWLIRLANRETLS